MKHFTLGIMMPAGIFAATTQMALAQGTLYTSRALFEQQLSSRTTITMESLQASSDADFVWGLGQPNITVSGVSFLSPPGRRLFVSNPGHLAYPIPGDGQYIFNSDSFTPVSIQLPAGVTGFGADLSGSTVNPTFDATLTVNLAGGGSYDYTFVGSRGSWTFFGVTFPEPIASLIYSDYNGAPSAVHGEKLDNVTFGAIPEPGAFGLLALGSFLLSGRRRYSARFSL